MEDTAVNRTGTVNNAGTEREDARTYTEEDIARLEAADLTNTSVCSELLTAYYQNDTSTHEDESVIERDLNVFVSEARLREMLEELEAIENPSARKRGDRLRVLSRLATMRKQNEGRSPHPAKTKAHTSR